MRRLVLCSSMACIPCKRLEKYLKARDLGYQKLTVEDNEGILRALNVTGLPTLLVVEDNREVARITGFVQSSIKKFLDEHLA